MKQDSEEKNPVAVWVVGLLVTAYAFVVIVAPLMVDAAPSPSGALTLLWILDYVWIWRGGASGWRLAGIFFAVLLAGNMVSLGLTLFYGLGGVDALTAYQQGLDAGLRALSLNSLAWPLIGMASGHVYAGSLLRPSETAG